MPEGASADGAFASAGGVGADGALASERAARAAAALIAGIAAFQAALSAGAPWGAAAWGGRHAGVLPAQLRRASAVSGVALGGLAVVIAVPGVLAPTARRRVVQGAAGYFAVGTVINAASRSRVERAIWTPVAAVAAGLMWWSVQGRRGAAVDVG